MVARIRTLLESRQLTPTQFADLIGIARPIVSHILSGRNKPSLEVVQRILAAMPELAMPWLLNGSGPMLSSAAASGVGAVPIAAASAPLASALANPEPTVPAVLSLPSSLASVAPQILEHKFVAQPLERQYGAPKGRGAAVQEAQGNSPIGKRPVSIDEPIGRAGQPAPFKPSLLEPAATPKRFVATAVATPQEGELYAQEVATLARSAAPAPADAPVPNAAARVTAMPSQPVQPVMATDGEPEAARTVPENTVAHALFAGAEKPIRRIVIFYHDGSFADYQPE